ncbi:hypothetical protein H6F51_23795 [Cyanobacteria bacterium FACHB-DQ100]|nr:hypothetical protein [Cyanobacteria bacterium FACHB-DQ100]
MARPRGTKGTPLTTWGEVKIRRSFPLTQTCFDLLGKKADQLGITRTELLERLSRALDAPGLESALASIQDTER